MSPAVFFLIAGLAPSNPPCNGTTNLCCATFEVPNAKLPALVTNVEDPPKSPDEADG